MVLLLCFFFGCPPEEKRRRRFCRRGCFCLAVLKVAVCRGGVFGVAVRRRARAREDPAACRYTRARLSYHDDDNDVLVYVDFIALTLLLFRPPLLSPRPATFWPARVWYTAAPASTPSGPRLHDTLSPGRATGVASHVRSDRAGGQASRGVPPVETLPHAGACLSRGGGGARSLVFQADGRRLTVLRFSSCCLRAVAYGEATLWLSHSWSIAHAPAPPPTAVVICSTRGLLKCSSFVSLQAKTVKVTTRHQWENPGISQRAQGRRRVRQSRSTPSLFWTLSRRNTRPCQVSVLD